MTVAESVPVGTEVLPGLGLSSQTLTVKLSGAQKIGEISVDEGVAAKPTENNTWQFEGLRAHEDGVAAADIHCSWPKAPLRGEDSRMGPPNRTPLCVPQKHDWPYPWQWKDRPVLSNFLATSYVCLSILH